MVKCHTRCSRTSDVSEYGTKAAHDGARKRNSARHRLCAALCGVCLCSLCCAPQLATAAQETHSAEAPQDAAPAAQKTVDDKPQATTATDISASHSDTLGAALLGQETSTQPKETVFSLRSYFQAVGVLFFLLAVLWFGARHIKKRGLSGGLLRFGKNSRRQWGDLTVEARHSLGPKSHLLIARFGPKKLLLGVTEHHITTLAEWLQQDEDAEPEQETPPPAAKPRQQKPRTRKRTMGPGDFPIDETLRADAESFKQHMAEANKKNDTV